MHTQSSEQLSDAKVPRQSQQLQFVNMCACMKMRPPPLLPTKLTVTEEDVYIDTILYISKTQATYVAQKREEFYVFARSDFARIH